MTQENKTSVILTSKNTALWDCSIIGICMVDQDIYAPSPSLIEEPMNLWPLDKTGFLNFGIMNILLDNLLFSSISGICLLDSGNTHGNPTPWEDNQNCL